MNQLTSLAMLVVSSFLATNISAATLNSKNNTAPETEQITKKVWLSIGADAHNRLASTQQHPISFTSPANIQPPGLSEVKLINISESQIPVLSEYMHEEFNRCGGFIFHDSLAEAQAYTQQLSQLSAQPINTLVSYSIDNPEGVSLLLNPLSTSNLESTVNTLAAFNNRYYTQQTGVDAAEWIQSHWQQISQGRGDISVELVSHSWSQPSVVATIQGTSMANEIVVLGGHLDSINQSSPSNGRAPGADDNASGIAVITEALRSIVATGYKPARTIKIMGYAAEEVGLRGSKAIAADYSANGENVVGVVQFDMTGNKGTAGRDIVFMTDYTNDAQNQFMMQLIDTYLSDIQYGTSSCGYGCSDHASWHNQGYPASMPFESNMSDSNSRIHTSSDTAYDSSHSYNFARLAVTYIAELAKSEGDDEPPVDNSLENGVPVSGLNATQGSSIEYTMEVPAGATDINFVMSGGSGDADLYVRFGSPATDSSYDCRPYKNGNNETCTMSSSGGTYYVRIKAYSTFSGVSLVGSYTKDGGPGGPDPIDETINDIGVAQGEWYYHTVNLAAGYGDLSVTISGGSGDADLYVNEGAAPTTATYDCRPYRWGNEETCSFTNPGSSTWHIGIRGYSNSSGLTLKVQANP